MCIKAEPSFVVSYFKIIILIIYLNIFFGVKFVLFCSIFIKLVF